MLCCVVLLAFVGFVFRRRVADEPFPPPARSNSASRPRREDSIRPAPLWPDFLRGAALGVLVYVVAVTVLLATGVVEAAASSEAEWIARDAAFALLALFGLLIASRGERPAAQPARPANARPVRTAAALLVGGGVAWTIAAIVDMHLFGMFEFAHGEALHDPVFHAVGFWAVVAGSLLFNRADARRAPAPAGSAVARSESN